MINEWFRLRRILWTFTLAIPIIYVYLFNVYGHMTTHTIYIPGITTDTPERSLAKILRESPLQQRSRLESNEILAGVAEAKAKDMAIRGYVAHTDPDGYGPNYHVCQAGYHLPDFYDKEKDANNIESLGVGVEQPWAIWDLWMHSPPHKTHLIGEIPFFREQDEYGIGFYADPDSPQRWYWCVLIARQEDN